MAREHPQAGGVPPPQKKNNKKNPRWIKSPLGPNLPFSHPVAHVGVGPSLVRAPPPSGPRPPEKVRLCWGPEGRAWLREGQSHGQGVAALGAASGEQAPSQSKVERPVLPAWEPCGGTRSPAEGQMAGQEAGKQMFRDDEKAQGRVSLL